MKDIRILIKISLLAFSVCGVLAVDETVQDDLMKNINVTRKNFNGMDVDDIIEEKQRELNLSTVFENLSYAVNFSAPGRRISEAKCLEFLWKYRFTELLDVSLYGKKTIIGGRRAGLAEFPHMGALGWKSATNGTKWIYKCGATLISEQFMLTAAHCSSSTSRDSTVANLYPEIVRFGDKFNKNKNRSARRRTNSNYRSLIQRLQRFNGFSTMRDENVHIEPVYVPIKRLISHEHYKSPKRYYDITIIELERSVSIGLFIRPACLWGSPDTNDLDKLFITGWGIVDLVTRQTTTELQVAKVDFIEDEICDEKFKMLHNRNWQGLADHQICAGVLPGGVDTCEGDSGGPLQVRKYMNLEWPYYFVLGVTSFGYSCAQPDMPGIYVKTSSFIDWIESIVWPEA